MSKLKIADDLSLPTDAVTQTFGILAKRRAGKSFAARRFTEQLFYAGLQVVIVDPKGDWWGIRSSSSGKEPGLPIVIVGGERGDVPLEAGGGEVVAKLVAEERVSALLDLSLLRKHEVATFMTAFLEALYRIKAREQYRTPVMLIIDEADAVAPQKPMKGEERMLGAAEDIVRRGGQRGIGCTLVTQRSAVLNKNVLTQVQVLVALRTIAPQDLAALNAWIDVHGTPQERETLMESLPALPVGDAWFWSPGWPTTRGIFERVHVLPIDTFDSGATPKPGERRVEPKNLADVDLTALKDKMAATIEKAKADDPKELRKKLTERDKKIADLERQLKASTVTVPEVKVERVEVPVIPKEQEKRIVEAFADMKASAARFDEFERFLKETMRSVERQKYEPPPARVSVPTRPPARSAPRERSLPSSNGKLPRGEAAVLRALIQYPTGLCRKQLTVLTGYKRSSRDAYISRLVEKGYVVSLGSDMMAATDDGSAAIPDAEPLPTGEALQEFWLSRLPAGEKIVLQVLIGAYPASVQRVSLDDLTNYKRSSRDAYLSRLAAKELVEETGRGEVRAIANLFEAL